MIVGFDDRSMSAVRGLTTVRPPLDALGREAAQVALAIARGERAYRNIELNADLIVRKSTCFDNKFAVSS
jgi:LacI family transcriptional regulator